MRWASPGRADPPTYVSFLVRLWREDGLDEQAAGWQGEVEQIQTGQRWQFDSLEEILKHLRHQVAVSEGKQP
jgi:hypothetical protein